MTTVMANSVSFMLTTRMANEIVELLEISSKHTQKKNKEYVDDISALEEYKDAHESAFAALSADPEANFGDIPISMTILQSILRINRILRPLTQLHLHQLLHGSIVYTKKASPPIYSPELQKYLKTLRSQQEKDEYKRLVADLPGNKPINTGPLNGVSSVTKDLSIAVNVLSILITGFVVFFYIGRGLFGDNLAMCVGCGCIGLIGGLLLETCLLIVRDKQERIVEEREIRREKQRFQK